MSEVRSVTTSEDQETPTFAYLAQQTEITSLCLQKSSKLFIDKDQSVQSVQSSDTELLQQRLKSCLIINNPFQKEQIESIETIASSQHYYYSKEMAFSEGKQQSQKKQLQLQICQELCKSQFIAQQNIKDKVQIESQKDISQKNEKKEASFKDNNKSQSSLAKNGRIIKDKDDQAFWKYIVHDNDPKMKRTIIKPCRFWMGQYVQYCKKDCIIKRVRREICQITIHPFDRSTILSSKTDILTENITKGSIIVKPNSNVRLNPQQIIIMTINKEYSFDISESKLMILPKKGQNRISLQKTKGHIMQNTLNVACEIDVKVYLNV